ncbi:MAG: hypothetical protein WA012_00500, partial [Rhodoferax sp.]|uniref:hypothetical protein n=1 Tax=Rhodoferax sp. TaxID=50421 RepID=UPI003BB0A18F
FEPNPNDDFKTEPQQDASFRRRVSGLPVRNPNPPASAGGCLVKVPNKCNKNDLFPCEASRMEKPEEIAGRVKFKSCMSALAGTSAT